MAEFERRQNNKMCTSVVIFKIGIRSPGSIVSKKKDEQVACDILQPLFLVVCTYFLCVSYE